MITIKIVKTFCKYFFLFTWKTFCQSLNFFFNNNIKLSIKTCLTHLKRIRYAQKKVINSGLNTTFIDLSTINLIFLAIVLDNRMIFTYGNMASISHYFSKVLYTVCILIRYSLVSLLLNTLVMHKYSIFLYYLQSNDFCFCVSVSTVVSFP